MMAGMVITQSSGSSPVRVLCSELMGSYAGTEAVILNYARRFDPERVKVDFIVRSEKIDYRELIPDGSRLIYLPPVGCDPLGYRKRLRELLPPGRFDVLWDNKNRLSNLSLLNRARKIGIPVRIVHSHNSRWDGSPIQRAAHYVGVHSLGRSATELWACSEAAGEGMFGGRPFTVVPNAIDFERVSFSAEGRTKKRAEWGLSDKFVVGVVGRLEPVKNHRFLINIADELVRLRSDIAFVFIGGGSLFAELEKACHMKGVSDRFVFAGQQTDMRSVYSALDCLVMPSLFEGLPLTAVEAQVNGLPCVLSDTVTVECSISTGARFVPLSSPEGWVDAIVNADRARTSLVGEKAELFNLGVQARALQERICKMAEGTV